MDTLGKTEEQVDRLLVLFLPMSQLTLIQDMVALVSLADKPKEFLGLL